jgi:uncharacterized protein YlxW (UPF0749 family)
VTGTLRGGGPRSIGASLLDDVLAETLDPAYAQAARVRSARAGETAGERRGGRWWRSQVLIGLTMVVAGLLAAVTYAQAATTSQGRQQVRAALIQDIRGASELSDELAGELEDVRAEVTAAREDVLARTSVGQQALEELARAEQQAGAVPVTGPGMLVLLANADLAADEDPVGGSSEEDPSGRVRDGDLQQVVNALWGAGAEAISINGQRLGPTSAIRFAGEAVLVDFRPVTNPYEISAVGDPEAMSRSFLENPQVASLAGVSEMFGLRFDFSQEDELTLPPAGTPELRSARSLAAEPADATPGG